MSRGRQKRVEKAQERRVESKKKKVRREIKSTYKALVQNQLFPLLEKINGVVGKVQCEGDGGVAVDADALHIWVDAPPSSRVSKHGGDGGYDDEDDEKEEHNFKKDKKQKSKGSKKKSHPRSSMESAGGGKGPSR